MDVIMILGNRVSSALTAHRRVARPKSANLPGERISSDSFSPNPLSCEPLDKRVTPEGPEHVAKLETIQREVSKRGNNRNAVVGAPCVVYGRIRKEFRIVQGN